MRDYVLAIAEGRLEDAKTHLFDALTSLGPGAEAVRSGISQRLGSILLKQGDTVTAMALYELSEALDEGSLSAKLQHAKFLFRELGDRTAAELKCEEVAEIARATPFPDSDDDFGSEGYLQAVRRLIAEIRE
ncbi:hypothetical protein [Roseateles chitosanitabidus]|uniref:hypothetical protein n=1 Tax=Roseateles chitosanitabidus TaxID=65048 RepID=UPI00083570B1|nr:hypothetical protein [Roseateles chitosanitabidus]